MKRETMKRGLTREDFECRIARLFVKAFELEDEIEKFLNPPKMSPEGLIDARFHGAARVGHIDKEGNITLPQGEWLEPNSLPSTSLDLSADSTTAYKELRRKLLKAAEIQRAHKKEAERAPEVEESFRETFARARRKLQELLKNLEEDDE
jgi:hypothetical protein